MVKLEWKKLWLHHQGAIFLALALLVHTALCLTTDTDTTTAIADHEEAYLSYIHRWQGALDGEKTSQIQAEYDALNHSDCWEAQENKPAFMEVYNQYCYAREDPAHRYLLDERGWNTLLTHDSMDFLLILSLLALCTGVFCGEYSCQMDGLLRTCRNGRETLARDKLLVLVAVAAITTLSFQGVRFLTVALRVELTGFSYPLQSLSFFETSPYHISLGQAYAAVVLCRIAGGAWFAVMTAYLSVLSQKIPETLSAGIGTALLPHLLENGFVKYILPLPTGLLAGAGYLWGCQTEPQYNADYTQIQEIVLFRGLSPREVCLLLGLYAAVFACMWMGTVRRYTSGDR